MHRHVVTLFVMFCVVISVTTHYLVWDMRSMCAWRLLQLKSWHKRKAYPYGKQKGGSVLMPSWMNIHNGNLTDYTPHSFFTGCSCMLQPLGGKNVIKPSARAGWQPSPEWDLEAESSTHRAHCPWVGQRKDEKGIQLCIAATELPDKSPCDEETGETSLLGNPEFCQGMPLA